MKKSIFTLPLLLLSLIICSCSSDSDYQISHRSQVDTDEITEAVNEALREAFQNTNFNDTIFNCDIDEDRLIVISNDSTAMTTSVMNRMPEIKINLMNDDSEWYSLQSEKNEQRSMVAIVSVVVPCVMIAIIIAVILLFFYYRMRNRNRVIEKAIENNYQLPIEFYSSSGFNTNNMSDVKSTHNDGSVPPPLPRNERMRVSGLRLVAIGLGLIIMFGAWGGIDAAVLGIIPLLIGASYLANYYNILK